MNLLVTNTYSPQSYAIIVALRSYAHRIVATMEGGSGFLARRAQAANSRLVDRRYHVPSPLNDWLAGNLQRDNTACEERFIQAVVKICREEKIDVIFPSWDPYVYLFSKNKCLFDSLGVIVPVPDYGRALMVLDKYRTILAAQEVGFPCPRTYLYESEHDLKRIVEREGFPLVIKPRVSSGGRGMAIVKDYPELVQKVAAIAGKHGNPMIQEYIPGRQRVTFPVVMGHEGELKAVFNQRIVRNFRVTGRFGAVEESVPLDWKLISGSETLLKKLGWWGPASVGTMRDPRDGQCKLMEINPRFSRNMWRTTALGYNEPSMCIKIARREAVAPVKDYPAGVLFVCPMEDIQLLALQIVDTLIYKFRVRVLRRKPLDGLSAPKSLREQIRSFLNTYLGGQRKHYDPHFNYFFRDPIVSILWWLRFSSWVIGALKHAGK